MLEFPKLILLTVLFYYRLIFSVVIYLIGLDKVLRFTWTTWTDSDTIDLFYRVVKLINIYITFINFLLYCFIVGQALNYMIIPLD